ncbi:MAG: MATE family efflux transporter [Victivallaceae bacterium]|nr:MATE family efflux transporter [Victivallaceae bacterium]
MKGNEIDMTVGPLAGKILVFFFPLAGSYILQLFFNAADLVVIGRYASSQSLAAVGATAPLTALLINTFIGFSICANVMVAQLYGARDYHGVVRAVHCNMWVSLVGGLVIGAIGMALSGFLLRISNVPDDIFDRSLTYILMMFAGTPFVSIFNFGSGVLRAIGDTRRPFVYITISGILNVVLNLVFVICMKMDVAGVALATLLTQGLSAVLVFRALIRNRGAVALRMGLMRPNRESLKSIFGIGLPAALQSSCYSISNALIQSTVNSYGSATIAGNTAAASIEAMIYIGSWAFHQTALSFVGQNYGARKARRMLSATRWCILFSMILLLMMGVTALMFSRQLLGFYNADPEVVKYGMMRMAVLCSTYSIIAFGDTVTGAMRGIGRTLEPALIVLACVLVLRVLWVWCVMPFWPSYTSLMISYPVSWTLSAVASAYVFHRMFRRLRREMEVAA